MYSKFTIIVEIHHVADQQTDKPETNTYDCKESPAYIVVILYSIVDDKTPVYIHHCHSEQRDGHESGIEILLQTTFVSKSVSLNWKAKRNASNQIR